MMAILKYSIVVVVSILLFVLLSHYFANISPDKESIVNELNSKVIKPYQQRDYARAQMTADQLVAIGDQ